MVEKNTMKARKKLIVPLDTSDEDRLKYLVDKLQDKVDVFKIGLEQYLASRGKVLDYLSVVNKKVFLDLKFHDIPNTMAAAARRAVAENVWMFNIHVTGTEGMKRVMEAARDEAEKKDLEMPMVIGVTVLTSLGDKDLAELGIDYTPAAAVLKRAKLAEKAGLNGVVSSAREAAIIKNECDSQFVTVCPGVRPEWASKGDQKRIMTPKAALEEGADYLVIGRPITQAENPAEAAEKILNEMEEAL
ncbi:MAG: orotidine-5'-phosphate decarboxylase [Halanaerobiales bacterium]